MFKTGRDFEAEKNEGGKEERGNVREGREGVTKERGKTKGG